MVRLQIFHWPRAYNAIRKLQGNYYPSSAASDFPLSFHCVDDSRAKLLLYPTKRLSWNESPLQFNACIFILKLQSFGRRIFQELLIEFEVQIDRTSTYSRIGRNADFSSYCRNFERDWFPLVNLRLLLPMMTTIDFANDKCYHKTCRTSHVKIK